jgi:hypothetical protein
MTLQEILESSCGDLLRYEPVIFINDHKISREYYHVIRPKAGCIISIRTTPRGGGGGKSPLKTVLSIAVLAIGNVAAGAFATSGALALFGGGVATASQVAFTGALIKGAVGIAGSLIVNSLAPPAKPKASTLNPNNSARDVSQTYFIQGARNRITPNGSLPELLGTHKIVPPMGAQTYTEVSGDFIYSRQVFVHTFGSISVSNEKIGDTLLSNYDDVSSEDKFSGNSAGTLSLYPGVVTQIALNVVFAAPTGFQTRTTAAGIDEFEVELTWPSGLGQYSTQGVKVTAEIEYEIRYALTGTGSWTTVSYSDTRKTTAAFSKSHRFSVTNGQYDVEVRRVTAQGSDRFFSTFTWTNIRSYKHQNPILKDGLSIKALRIKGSDQLNGAVDQYNCIASRTDILDWNGSSWVAGATSNPASIFRHILQSSSAKTQIDNSEILLSDIQSWHEYCTLMGFTYDAYIDYEADRETLLREVAAAGLAIPTIIDNKYSVVVDRPKTDIIQAISARNSRDYKYEKVFSETPHAMRVEFINKNQDYNTDQIIVYNDGYSSSNATEFFQMDFPGVVNTNALYKLARHRLAEIIHRPDMHSVIMDIEHLVATKGDRVEFSHDVPLIGLGSGRVKSVSNNGTNITGVVMDEVFAMESGKTYNARFRLSNNTYITRAIVNTENETSALTFSSPEVIANGPSVGDMGFFGEAGSITLDGVIHSIQPLNDNEAEIKIVNYGAAIFSSYSGTIPSYSNTITIPPEFKKPNAPTLKAVQTDEEVQVRNFDGSISNRMVITLNNSNLTPVEPIVLFKDQGESTFREPTLLAKTANKIVFDDLEIGSIYNIVIRYRKLGGPELGSNAVSDSLELNGIQFIGVSGNPPDVENFDITVRGESVYLEWTAVNVLDLDHYELRFSSQTSGATWSSSIPINENISKESISITAPSSVGTYLIKAVDKLGNYSENASLAVTTIGKLLSLNVVETINEHTTWGGTLDGISNAGGVLKLGAVDTVDDWTSVDSISSWDIGESGIAQTGTYTFQNTVDLGAVYDNVLTASLTISSESLGNNIDLWSSIDSRNNWDGVTSDQYNVDLEVRTTNDDPNATPVWSNWKKFIIGEYTARAFEFRLILTANITGVTPIVSQAIITIDMPDRLESDDDIPSGTGGKIVTFSEAFRVAPTVVITADNMVTGDYFTITSVSATNFLIEFFNSSATSIDRTFSYVAKGYGRAS